MIHIKVFKMLTFILVLFYTALCAALFVMKGELQDFIFMCLGAWGLIRHKELDKFLNKIFFGEKK